VGIAQEVVRRVRRAQRTVNRKGVYEYSGETRACYQNVWLAALVGGRFGVDYEDGEGMKGICVEAGMEGFEEQLERILRA
jgi:hypothetical protein